MTLWQHIFRVSSSSLVLYLARIASDLAFVPARIALLPHLGRLKIHFRFVSPWLVAFHMRWLVWFWPPLAGSPSPPISCVSFSSVSAVPCIVMTPQLCSKTMWACFNHRLDWLLQVISQQAMRGKVLSSLRFTKLHKSWWGYYEASY